MASSQFEFGSALAAALLLITMIVVNRALAPVRLISDAMMNIESGYYNTRVTVSGSAEIATICDKLNHLALTLGQAVEEKQCLAGRLVSLQDIERKDIAWELHDEFGPHLFALRAHADSLKRIADGTQPDTDGLRRHGGAMLDQVNALQQFNRRILEKLRPVGLHDLGLKAALGAAVQFWRDTRPDVTVEMTISPALEKIGDTAELTVYRVVQEALTNVFRHSGATCVSVEIETADPTTKTVSGDQKAVRVRVQHDGEGLAPAHKLGHGMTGMRERVLALGGTLTVVSIDSGVTLEAVIPDDPRS